MKFVNLYIYNNKYYYDCCACRHVSINSKTELFTHALDSRVYIGYVDLYFTINMVVTIIKQQP